MTDTSYHENLLRFTDDLFEAGKDRQPFEEALEAALEAHGIHYDDRTDIVARERYDYGIVKSFYWTPTEGGQQAGAVTSGGLNVLLRVDRSTRPACSMWEVNRDGVPWRLIGRYPTVNAAVAERNLVAP